MAADPLMIVWGRIAFLDIYALAPMVWGVALYLRGRVLGAAALLAVADCMKEASIFALLVIGLLELFTVSLHARLAPGRPRRPAAGCAGVAPGAQAAGARGGWQRGTVHPRAVGNGADRPALLRGQRTTAPHLGRTVRAPVLHHQFRQGVQRDLRGHPAWQWWYDHGAMTLLRVNPAQSGCHVPPDYPAGVTCLPDALPGPRPPGRSPGERVLSDHQPTHPRVRDPGARRLRDACAASTTRVPATSRRRGGGARARLDDRHVGAVRAAEPRLPPHQLALLHGHRDARGFIAVSNLAYLLWRRQSTWLHGGLVLYGLTVLAAVGVLYPFAAIL